MKRPHAGDILVLSVVIVMLLALIFGFIKQEKEDEASFTADVGQLQS